MLFSEFSRGGFDPFLEMRRMQQEMNRRLAELGTVAAQEFPPMNLWVGDTTSMVVTAELPGPDPKWTDVSVHEATLTLRGTRGRQATGEAPRARRAHTNATHHPPLSKHNGGEE